MAHAKAKQAYTLKELAEISGSSLEGNPEHLISGIAGILEAGQEHAVFVGNPRYAPQLQKTQAGVVCVSPTESCPPHLNKLVHKDPSSAFQKIAELLAHSRPALTGFKEIHPTAVIHPDAKIGEGVTIGPYAVIDEGAQIGKGSRIGSHVYIGPQATLGTDCLIHPHVTIREGCVIGNRVILQPGVVIGGCGFGYATSAMGEHTKFEHLGNVILEDDVEIGSNTTIDRARFQSTKVSKGTKIDNLVMLGHNVTVGKNSMIVAQTGIAGSTTLGDYCIIAGQVAIAGHLNIESKTRIAGKSGVTKSLPTGDYSGIPVQPIQEYNKNAVLLRKMPEFVEELKKLRQELEELKRSRQE